MVDIATRVYNHTWKIDPIVRSVVDTDFYKLLMAQTIFRRHMAVQVTFEQHDLVYFPLFEPARGPAS